MDQDRQVLNWPRGFGGVYYTDFFIFLFWTRTAKKREENMKDGWQLHVSRIKASKKRWLRPRALCNLSSPVPRLG